MGYVLLVLSLTNTGFPITGVPFADKPACEAAMAWVLEHDRDSASLRVGSPSNHIATCAPQASREGG
jgi:hypothetical protein